MTFSTFTVHECARSVVSDSLQPHGLETARLLFPWDFPGKNTGVGCGAAFLQRLFLSQESNPSFLCLLLLWQSDSLPLPHLGSPKEKGATEDEMVR